MQQNLIDVDIRPLFGLADIQRPVFMKGYSEPGPATPASNPDYIWQRSQIQDMLVFFQSGEISMQAIGHTGTGKSSFYEEFHARLNLALYVVNGTPRTEAGDLIAKFAPNENGGLSVQYGPVARAALEGCSCLIDEYNVIDPAEATGLNALLEGRAVFLPETGQWITPQPGFRVFTTINPKTLGYVGRNTQDIANDDRFDYMYFDYMPAEKEVELLTNVLLQAGMKDKTVAQELAGRFREVAESVRKAYMGESDDASALDITLSTRSVVRWAKKTILFGGVRQKGYSPVHYALERSRTFKASPESRIAVHAFVTQVFDEAYKTPMTDVGN